MKSCRCGEQSPQELRGRRAWQLLCSSTYPYLRCLRCAKRLRNVGGRCTMACWWNSGASCSGTSEQTRAGSPHTCCSEKTTGPFLRFQRKPRASLLLVARPKPQKNGRRPHTFLIFTRHMPSRQLAISSNQSPARVAQKKVAALTGSAMAMSARESSGQRRQIRGRIRRRKKFETRAVEHRQPQCHFARRPNPRRSGHSLGHRAPPLSKPDKLDATPARGNLAEDKTNNTRQASRYLLITRRSQVQILPAQPRTNAELA